MLNVTRVAVWACGFLVPALLRGYTKTGTVYQTVGHQLDVAAAVAHASPGDTVLIPPGKFTWGGSASSIFLTKRIALVGSGPGRTTIYLSTNGPTYGSGVIAIKAPCVVRDFSIQGTSRPVTAISADAANGWRITNVVYNGGPAEAYFCYVGGVYGLIDHCRIWGGVGSAELIFARGPTDSWQTANSLGRGENVFVEDCVFGGSGYVCDANANARMVVRYCRIEGRMKIDGHGLASNTPARGVRHMEIYGNIWTSPELYYAAIELRGGSGRIFDNQVPYVPAGEAANVRFFLTEYGVKARWPNFNSTFQTPADYPIADQIGVGRDPRVGGSEPVYLWNNTVQQGADWTLQWGGSDSPGAVARFREQTGDPGATFKLQDVIQGDRDYFKHTVGVAFSGETGVGVGSRAEMMRVRPVRRGIGFWVTEEGEWNSEHAGPDGQLYTWDGASWVLAYVPFSYPHPLQRPL